MKSVQISIIITVLIIIFTYTQPVAATNLSISDEGLIVSEDITREDSAREWNKILLGYKNFVIGFFGIATISMLGLFIYSFIQLGTSAGNPQARSGAIHGLLWSGIATALLGGTLFFFGMFYYMV